MSTATRRAATSTARKRRARTESRTKKVVKLIKRDNEFDTLDVVKMYIPENKFNHLSPEAQSEVIKLGAGLIEAVRAGQYDLRQAM